MSHRDQPQAVEVVEVINGEEGMAVVISKALRGGGYNAMLRDTDAEQMVGGIVNATLAQAQAWGRKTLGLDAHPLSRLYELTGYEPEEEHITLADQADLFASKKVPSIEEIWKKHGAPKGRAELAPGRPACNSDLAPYQWLDVSVCVSRTEPGRKLPVIRDAAGFVRVLLQIYPKALTGLQEHIIAVAVDVRMQPVGAVLVAKGSLAEASAGIPDILRPVIMLPAKAFIIAHNHPSGGAEPSDADNDLTAVVAHAAATVHLKLLDHLILTRDPAVFYSYKNANSPALEVERPRKRTFF